MGSLRENLLKQQLQREIDIAKELEARGKTKQALIHYKTAASIYRRLAYISSRENAENFFSIASQYEQMSNIIRSTTPYTRVKSLEAIESMVVSEKPVTKWEDIGGLEDVKKEIKEAIILPMIHNKPDFVDSPRVILLYGPPGTGKTLLAKAASSTLNANFFDARISSLLSKYFGESSKIIDMLFEKARSMQPSVIFMDEFDAIMLSRDSDIHEGTRRVISQILVEIEGFRTAKDEKVILIAATNKPWDLDDAMISRFQRRIYVPLPDHEARKQIFEIHLKGTTLDNISLDDLAEKSEGYSGRDIANVCREAIMFMIREQNPSLEELTPAQIEKYSMNYRSLTRDDFDFAFSKVKRTVDDETVKKYEEWKERFGS
ncbi:MAG: ATP-binding protein [Candidatus Aenigmarchaeota archaeon]|nr:ATP-binding protein [Candidatus Aenigmarchaeota archaeon]